jgi:hypothetical protein
MKNHKLRNIDKLCCKKIELRNHWEDPEKTWKCLDFWFKFWIFPIRQKLTVPQVSVVALILVLVYEIWGFAMVRGIGLQGRETVWCGTYDHLWRKGLHVQRRHAPTDYCLHFSIIIIIIININIIINIIIIIIIIITAIELSLGGGSPYTRTNKRNKNKYT